MSIYIDVLESEVKIKQNLMSTLIYHPLMLVLLWRLKGHFTRSQQYDERKMLLEKILMKKHGKIPESVL
jgi:hypothetical protein